VALNPEARALIAKVNKTLGDGSVLIGSDIKIARRYTSGALSLDVALGGGWPANQPIEVIGHESHGKTAVVLKTIAANMAQDPNFTAFWLAAEPFDTDQAEALGVDIDRMIVHPTQAMEEAYETMLAFMESRAVDCVVLDSYPALIADEEAEKGMDEAVMAIGARATGKFFRKAGKATRRSLTDPEDKPLLGPIIINQFRDAIGKFSPQGTPKTTPGGNAKNYAFYVRVEVARAGWIDEKVPGKDLKIRVGQNIKVKTIKNKAAAPQQAASLDFYFRDAPVTGFERGQYDDVKDMVIMGLLFDVLQRKGAYFQFENGQTDPSGKPLYRWQGKDAMFDAIRSDIDLREELTREVLDRAKNPNAISSISEDDVDAAEAVGTKTVTRKAAA